MSEISSLALLTDEQLTKAWTLLEPMVQAAITHRLHQFHDALVNRGQIAGPTGQTDGCVAVEVVGPLEQAHSAAHGECSNSADMPGSSLAPLPGGQLH